jgi:hypothetical protein
VCGRHVPGTSDTMTMAKSRRRRPPARNICACCWSRGSCQRLPQACDQKLIHPAHNIATTTNTTTNASKAPNASISPAANPSNGPAQYGDRARAVLTIPMVIAFFTPKTLSAQRSAGWGSESSPGIIASPSLPPERSSSRCAKPPRAKAFHFSGSVSPFSTLSMIRFASTARVSGFKGDPDSFSNCAQTSRRVSAIFPMSHGGGLAFDTHC